MNVENTTMNLLEPFLGTRPFDSIYPVCVKYRPTDDFIKNQRELISQEDFFKDKSPSFYVCRVIKKKKSYLGIIGLIPIENYLKSKVRPHEKIIHQHQEQVKKMLETTKIQVNPALVTYQGSSDIHEILSSVTQKKPNHYVYLGDDFYEIWAIQAEKDIAKIKKNFTKVNSLYIADGHHRFSALADLFNTHQDKDNQYGHVLSFLVSDDQIEITNDQTAYIGLIPAKRFTLALDAFFEVRRTQKFMHPEKVFELSMFLNDAWYLLNAKQELLQELATHGMRSINLHAIKKYIVDHLLPTVEIREEKILVAEDRIKKIEKVIRRSGGGVAFVTRAIASRDIFDLVEKNQFMPPKTTLIEPKLPDFLISYLFE